MFTVFISTNKYLHGKMHLLPHEMFSLKINLWKNSSCGQITTTTKKMFFLVSDCQSELLAMLAGDVYVKSPNQHFFTLLTHRMVGGRLLLLSQSLSLKPSQTELLSPETASHFV